MKRLLLLATVLFAAGCVHRPPAIAPDPPSVRRIVLGTTIPDETLICVAVTDRMAFDNPNLPSAICWGTMATLRKTLVDTWQAN